MKTVAFHTLGCKLNFAETAGISRGAIPFGYTIKDFHEVADVYVIHSCLVTSAAERKTLMAVKQAARRNPRARIAVIGCMPELNAERLRQTESVDIALGNSEKFNLFEYLADEGRQASIHPKNEFNPSWSVNERSRSFLKIQDGCDYFCSYCTIPYARGRSRSHTIEGVLAAARSIAGEGIREIVLTGVNIGDFGKHTGESLYELLSQLVHVGGLKRIRISSIEPDLLDDRIIELAAAEHKLLPHFHIPLQSGSDKVLKLMNRRYTTAQFAAKVNTIRKMIPYCCIATDIITGFPGENEQDFKDTVNFIDSLGLSYMHVFTYSERKNTRAAGMENRVTPAVKKERSEVLHRISEQMKKRFYESHAGCMASVFFESEKKKGFIYGFTENYIRVRHPWSPSLVNSITDVKLQALADDGCMSVSLIEQ